MSNHSVTQILRQLRHACSDDDRQAAAEKLYDCYRIQVERIARGRLPVGGGLADEQDVAQSAFRSFFCRIETGQMDALVNGGQAWAILSRLTRNKAIDLLRYNNAMRRGGAGSQRETSPLPSDSQPSDSSLTPDQVPASSQTRNRLAIGDKDLNTQTSSRDRETLREPPNQAIRRGNAAPREEVPLESVRDQTQRSAEEEAASKEFMERFLEELSEATLRGIVSLKLQGFTNDEIAEKLGCATRTVERKLNLIRRLWLPILEESDEGRTV